MNTRLLIFTTLLSAILVAITMAYLMGGRPEDTAVEPMEPRPTDRRVQTPRDVAAVTESAMPVVEKVGGLAPTLPTAEVAAAVNPPPGGTFTKRWSEAGEEMRRAGLEYSEQLGQYGELLSVVPDERFVQDVRPLILAASVYDPATEALCLDLGHRNLTDTLPIWAEIRSKRTHPLYDEAERYLRFHLGDRYSPDVVRTREIVEQMVAAMAQQ